MAHPLVHSKPCEASAEAGHVILDSDCGLALTMTAEAASATAQRLVAAARRAFRPSRKDGSEANCKERD